ncbi:malic enzyme-like NAD(P)-binding protein [Thiomicrorhabdus xiamenensis]|uniref:NADP-dependent malic enzyme n=1 Tax=Thiomicrorhabdus xiamenensis TaxID=2739063 RepID=A0A7D4SRB7_9GAMM|nr:malic enzyme-like NAD(P)-binding protein [Thiomicrorhabdus xiamenensis]QKI88283.1 malate dehydrogenase [Thiomicrorhabdus xiamenensis]
MKQAALNYHREAKPGKLSVEITKPADTQQDLSLAYSPGVAEPVKEIMADSQLAYDYTIKGNLVAVVTNGTATLGLGNTGALASKPVMEGKALLFKRFANIDSFDIEIDETDVDKFVEIVTKIAPTFGGINLEDIAAPACFEIEQKLIEALDIPVFHDDQHGTAIICVAALLNALQIQNKALADAKIVCVGAGAAGIAILNLLLESGAQHDNILLLDSKGVVHSGRDDLNVYKQAFAVETDKRTLTDAMQAADVFLGLSVANLLTAEMLLSMAARPVVLAMANPDPEVLPEAALAIRDDIIIGTGRSDYPNQVNNVLGFPYIFRAALDCRAKEINSEMKLACVEALRNLAKEPVSQQVLDAYGLRELSFGKDYILPKPTDSRLLQQLPPAIIQAAKASGVAREVLGTTTERFYSAESE